MLKKVHEITLEYYTDDLKKLSTNDYTLVDEDERLIEVSCSNQYKGDDETVVFSLHVALADISDYKILWQRSSY